MAGSRSLNIDVSQLETPCYVVDLGALDRNLEILASISHRAHCKILLALKGFAMWSVFQRLRDVLAGTAASSLHEARLGREEFGGEVHACAPAYSDAEFGQLLTYVDHVTFNSFSQWERLRGHVGSAQRKVHAGIRINPEHSEVDVALYDPCAAHSRLGVPLAEFREDLLDGISGLHFHTLCELGSDALERTLQVVENRFSPYLRGMRWVNFGGGHHITRANYDRDHLVELVRSFQDRYGVDVYLEPGEAIALETGVLVASVLDIVRNGMDIAILDTSATTHMPDVLEMPYRPRIVGAGMPGDRAFDYRLGGLTCLAGDVIGDYSFSQKLNIGDKLVFLDMAHYTMVKNTTFNGVRLPSIATHDPSEGRIEVIRRFGYEDYKHRLS